MTNVAAKAISKARVTGKAQAKELKPKQDKSAYVNPAPKNEAITQKPKVYLNEPFLSSPLAVAHAAKHGIVNILKAIKEIQPCHVIPEA